MNQILVFTKIPVFQLSQSQIDFPPPKVTSDWLRPHVHVLYQFVSSINNCLNESETEFIGSFIDGHKINKVIDEVNW